MKLNKTLFYIISIFFLLLVFSGCTSTETKKNNLTYEDKDIYVLVILRSPDQMQAFYEGREFPKAAIDKLIETCNIAVIVKNKTSDILWLILDEWSFISSDKSGKKSIPRMNRSHWAKKWDEVKLGPAHRSTFGWTLLPEVRDLRPDEGVGGGLSLPKQSKSLDLILNFPTGKDKKGPLKSVTMKNISCAKNADKNNESSFPADFN